MSDYIPFEIQVDIIKRLPIKSLIRFRSVSKEWKSLIESTEFIANYNARHAHSRRLFISYNDPVKTEQKYVSFVDDQTFPQKMFTPTVPLFFNKLKDLKIIGSSHGLLCLHGYIREKIDSRSNSRTEMAVVWNPSIRKSVAIDVPKVLDLLYEIVLGFGICPCSNDPKLVKITFIRMWWGFDSFIPMQVEVFTLGSGSWRNLSSNLPRQSIMFSWSQVAMDGFVFWCVCDRIYVDGAFSSLGLIMSFDLTTEEFTEVDLPNYLSVNLEIDLSIFKLRESLAVVEHNTYDQVYSVWMMENGVQKSFTKLFTIKAPYESISCNLGFRTGGEPIMEMKASSGTDKLTVYEPCSENINDLGIHGKTWSFSVKSYVETLFLLDLSDSSIYFDISRG